MIKQIFSLAIAATTIISCRFDASIGTGDKTVKSKEVSTTDGQGLTGAVIKNDIDLEASGVKVNNAYLMNDQRELLDSNVVGLGQNVIFTLDLDTGWNKIDDRSYIGASEKIIGSDGTVLLDAPDLFKDYESTGMPSKIARLINLKAVIQRKIPGIDNYTVSFKIWDRKGSGTVSGKFKFRVI